MIYEHNFEIKICDVGRNLELRNKSLLSFFEEIGNLQSATIGLGVEDVPKTNLSWIILSWKVEIIKRPVYGEEIKIKSWARGTNKLHCYREYEVYDNKTGEVLAKAISKWALLDLTKRRPVILTDKIPEEYEENNKFVFSEEYPKRIIEPKEYEHSSLYTIKRVNIDLNNHTHNLDYLDIAYEVLPEDVFYNAELNNIEIVYKKETMLNDTLKCLYAFENNEHIVTIKDKDEKIVHAIIKLY